MIFCYHKIFGLLIFFETMPHKSELSFCLCNFEVRFVIWTYVNLSSVEVILFRVKNIYVCVCVHQYKFGSGADMSASLTVVVCS